MSRQYLHRACKKGAPKPPKSESRDISKTFESNFDKVVENIALESKKCNYNPEIGMNWCNLPMEMRRECVKRMNFQTRCYLRGVSKFEKSLVDSKKYKFKHLKIVSKPELVGGRYNWRSWEIIAKSGDEESELYIRTKDRLNEKCLSAIFKYAEVENFRLTVNNGNVRRILDQLAQFAPFPFKRVSLSLDPCMDIFMQTCPNLEKVDIFGYLPYKEMLKFPSLMKIKEFKLWHVGARCLQDFVPELVKKWIDNDVEVGKSVQCFDANREIGDKVTEKFADRIIEKTDKVLRIRMNNEKTQILMRHISSKKRDYVMWFCSCKVIPIDLPKSEYKKGDRWIQVMERSQRYRRLVNSPELEAEDKEIWGFL